MSDNEKKKTLREMPYPYNLMEVLREQVQGADEADLADMDFTPSAIRAMVQENLTERETQIIEMRYRDKMSLEQTAIAHNVTRERIRQIEAKALRKLNHPGRLKSYAAVPYRAWLAERVAREKAEQRLDWFLQHGSYAVVLAEKDVRTSEEIAGETYIEDLDLSVRSFNCLKRAQINTVAQILALDYDVAIHIRNLGKRSLEEIVRKIHEMGLLMKWERSDGVS